MNWFRVKILQLTLVALLLLSRSRLHHHHSLLVLALLLDLSPQSQRDSYTNTHPLIRSLTEMNGFRSDWASSWCRWRCCSSHRLRCCCEMRAIGSAQGRTTREVWTRLVNTVAGTATCATSRILSTFRSDWWAETWGRRTKKREREQKEKQIESEEKGELSSFFLWNVWDEACC